MIASKESFEPHSSDELPNSKRVYINGQQNPDLRVPMREIELAPTTTLILKAMSKKACLRCVRNGFATGATWKSMTDARCCRKMMVI